LTPFNAGLPHRAAVVDAEDDCKGGCSRRFTREAGMICLRTSADLKWESQRSAPHTRERRRQEKQRANRLREFRHDLVINALSSEQHSHAAIAR
jgi:hypothetical protein